MSGSSLGLRRLREDGRVTVDRGGPLRVETRDGAVLLVTEDGHTARVIEADIECSGGVIHLIDSVITEVRLDWGLLM